jgi:hypothetical protein
MAGAAYRSQARRYSVAERWKGVRIAGENASEFIRDRDMPAERLFGDALNQYFGGKPDAATIDILDRER